MILVLCVAAGAAVGAPARYLTDRAVQARLGTALPWGTFTVNVVGSFVLGLVTALAPDPAVQALVGTGFCGALTTYSTFGYETFVLAERGSLPRATANLLGSVVVGLAAGAVGYLAGGGAL